MCSRSRTKLDDLQGNEKFFLPITSIFRARRLVDEEPGH